MLILVILNVSSVSPNLDSILNGNNNLERRDILIIALTYVDVTLFLGFLCPVRWLCKTHIPIFCRRFFPQIANLKTMVQEYLKMSNVESRLKIL